jgi:hypothetical protein
MLVSSKVSRLWFRLRPACVSRSMRPSNECGKEIFSRYSEFRFDPAVLGFLKCWGCLGFAGNSCLSVSAVRSARESGDVQLALFRS